MTFFKKDSYGQSVPSHFHKCFRLLKNYASLKIPFGHYFLIEIIIVLILKNTIVQFARSNGTFLGFVELLKNYFGQFVWIEFF